MRWRVVIATVGLLASLVVSGARAAAPPPSGFVVAPNITDPSCNGGRGIRFAAPLDGGNASVSSGTLGDGSTLIALSQIYPGKNSVLLDSVTSRCELNPAFGEGGSTTLSIHLRASHPRSGLGSPPAGVLWIGEVAQMRGGGAILGGTYGDEWLVGEVGARGQLETGFGEGGWVVLPYPGEVTAVLQEPSGQIVVGGDNNGGGCCTRNYAAALTAGGTLERGYGTDGRLELPTGEDSGVSGLAREPNGDTLAQVSYGLMGCWGLELTMLTPSGDAVPGFSARLDRFWQRLGFAAFEGDAYVDGDGFTLIGSGQKPCASDGSFTAPSATGFIARFRGDGQLVAGPIRFPSRIVGAQGFGYGADTIVFSFHYGNEADEGLMALRPDGSVDPSFGRDGRVSIRAPGTGSKDAYLTTVMVERSGPGEVVLVATGSANQVQLIRVRV